MDAGSYGGYVNTHACSHKDEPRAQARYCTVQYNRAVFTTPRYSVCETKGSREGGDREEGKNKK